jgi:hypothetical protein
MKTDKLRPAPNDTGLSLSKKYRLKEDGKEKSYERNPSGVSLVFNQKVFGTF